MDQTGTTGGFHYLLNSGCMSTSNGPNAGRSKAICICHVWLVCEIPDNLDLDFGPAWTAINIKFINAARLPIFMNLVKAVEDKYWVSYSATSFIDNFSISRPTSTTWICDKLSCPPLDWRIFPKVYLVIG